MKNEIIKIAEEIATKAHEGQFRRDGKIPYIEHPKAVVSRVGEDCNAQVVAWLHDVIEDTNITASDLLDKGITEEQINAIALMTKTKEIPYEEYLEKIASCPLASKVKIADMISNLADNPTKNQIKKYAKGLQRLTRDI